MIQTAIQFLSPRDTFKYNEQIYTFCSTCVDPISTELKYLAYSIDFKTYAVFPWNTIVAVKEKVGKEYIISFTKDELTKLHHHIPFDIGNELKRKINVAYSTIDF